jgi:hypothetical protein
VRVAVPEHGAVAGGDVDAVVGVEHARVRGGGDEESGGEGAAEESGEEHDRSVAHATPRSEPLRWEPGSPYRPTPTLGGTDCHCGESTVATWPGPCWWVLRNTDVISVGPSNAIESRKPGVTRAAFARPLETE